jgi:nitrate reductase NapE component
MNARCEGFQCAYIAWNNFITEKHVPSIHDKSEVLIAVKILMVVLWVVISCGLVGGYQRALSVGMRQYAPRKCWNPSTSPHSVTAQKTIINMRNL